jgi:putative intracellular protease/amidase
MTHILVVCSRRYNGHELWVALGVLAKRGHTFDLLSTSHVIEDEDSHKKNKIKMLVGDVDKIEIGHKYQAFMIISGNPKDTEDYWHNDTVRDYVKKANAFGLPIAAICASVPSIRDAADGKHVSYFPLIRSRELLRTAGAFPQSVALTRDANLVTAEHEMVTFAWAEEFCNLIEGLPQEHFFTPSAFTPKGGERKPIPIVEDLRRKLNRE